MCDLNPDYLIETITRHNETQEQILRELRLISFKADRQYWRSQFEWHKSHRGEDAALECYVKVLNLQDKIRELEGEDGEHQD